MKKRRVVIQVEVETSARIEVLTKWLRVLVRGTELRMTERPRINVIRKGTR
jgi:hypothetical protein